jgi:hypothetical protein
VADWTIVRTVGTEEEAALLAGYLEAAGIEAQIESLPFHQEPVNFGKLGEVRVPVDAGAIEAADRALADEAERQAESALDAAEQAGAGGAAADAGGADDAGE